MIMQAPYLLVKDTGEKGRGVFCTAFVEADTIIEISPVIVMEGKDRIELDKTLLHDYIFEWGAEKKECCMALGLIPIYNHSYESNCEYFMDFEENMMMIKTVRDIEEGEELTINYNGDWNDGRKVWFETS
ncbi:MAG: SET domain-containing protein-lysine N-methyltransferase [Ferruginibacter sp.]